MEVSGACYYPSNNIKFLRLNDVKNTASVTALRIEGPKQSVNERIQNLQKIFSEYNDQTVLEVYQSNLFWKITANLECFSNSPNLIAKISLPPSVTSKFVSTFAEDPILRINNKYFLDWAGGLVWIEIDNADPSFLILEKMKKFCIEHGGHITVVKADLNYRRTGLFISSNDENIKILSAKVKNSFDPKSILNPGKIYAGI